MEVGERGVETGNVAKGSEDGKIRVRGNYFAGDEI